MYTGLQSTFFGLNRITVKEDLADYFLEYYRTTFQKLNQDVLFPQPGLFQSVALAADGNDKFKLTAYDPTGMALGRILAVNQQPTDYCVGVQFENASGIDYHVAISHTDLPVGIEVGPLDGQPRVKYLKEIIGGGWTNPDSVVDNLDGTLTFVVDAATEAAVSNAGRKVWVAYLPSLLPAKGATDENKAWQIIDVVWDSTNNKITTSDVAPKDGYFGQTTPSTTAADYYVFILGPVVKRNTDLSLSTDHAYCGTVKGVGAGSPPSVFDTSGQIIFGTAGMSYLGQITRIENVPPNRLKIDVKAIAAESGVDQIRVTHPTSGVVFSVDEVGNVTIEGDLAVTGETTQEDLVTVNASEIIADNLTLGDADGDSHLVKGTWAHKNAAETETWFVVDSAQSGHIGIGGAADATKVLNIVGQTQASDDIVPTVNEGAELGQVSPTIKRWNRVLSKYGLIEIMAISGVAALCTVETDLPSYILTDADASAVNDQRHWHIECKSNGALSFRSYDDDHISSMAFLTATKNATGYAVDYVTLSANVLIDLSSDVEVGGDLKAKVGGDRDLGGPGTAEWALFYLKDDAGYGVAGHFVPNADGTLTLGNWVWGATDTGYRWANLLATELSAIKASEPSVYLRKTGIAADEKTWRLHIDAGDDLVLETMSDAPASGVSVLKVTRGTGTAVTQAEFFVPLLAADKFYVKGNDPYLYLYEDDQAADEGKWRFEVAGSVFALRTVDDAESGTIKVFDVTRTGAAPVLVTFYYPTTFVGDIQARSSSPKIQIHDTNGTANERSFEWTVVSDELIFRLQNDAFDTPGTEVFGLERTANVLDRVRCGATFVPSGSSSLGDLTDEWVAGYFSGNLYCQGCHVDGDSGGIANTVTWTYTVSGVSTGTGSIVMNSANPGTNTGWIAIRIGTALKWMPTWDTNAP